MPENQTPATQPDPSTGPGELNFDKPAPENPRIKRRSLKTKQADPAKLANGQPTVSRSPERPAFTPSAEPARTVAAQPAPSVQATQPVKAATSTNTAPATRTTAPVSATTAPAASAPTTRTTTPTPSTTTAAAATAPAAATAKSPTSPHGTRPATLYYSSYPRKEKEVPTAMKSTPTASSSAAAATPVSATRTTASAAAPRAAAPVDYRANVERQSREQKSVGNILSYIVWGLIGFFVIGAALAGYGGYVLSQRISDQSVTVRDLDSRYAAANKDLLAKLQTTQDALLAAQAQVNRQQDLITREQDTINKLLATTADTSSAVKAEKAARAQETAALRARVRDLENSKPTTVQRY